MIQLIQIYDGPLRLAEILYLMDTPPCVPIEAEHLKNQQYYVWRLCLVGNLGTGASKMQTL